MTPSQPSVLARASAMRRAVSSISARLIGRCATASIRSLAEAIARGNDVVYGLTAGVYSSRQEDVDLFFATAEAGVLYANRRSNATAGAWPGYQSFGGWKGSGLSGKSGLGPNYVPLFMREQSHTLIKPA